MDNSEGSYSDNIPSTSGVKRKRKSLSQGKVSNTQSDWRRNDICSDMPSWKNVVVCQNQLSPVDTFFLFFDDEVIDMLVDYTNRYAALHNREGDIQPNEMRCFFAILLLSGYTNVSRREMYWENALDSNNPLVCNAMARNRFRFIMQNIHCNDNNGLNKDDRFSKPRPLCDVLNKRFIEFSPCEGVHSIDETMVPYFGRHGTKQFIRGKPIRWGYGTGLWTGTTRLGYIE